MHSSQRFATTGDSGVMSNEPDVILLGFASALRAAGIPVPHDRAATMLRAAAAVGLEQERALYFAMRATVCSESWHLRVYDDVFESWFHKRPGSTTERLTAVRDMDSLAEQSGVGHEGDLDQSLGAHASTIETLKRRDIADLSQAEHLVLTELIRTLRPRLPSRLSFRRDRWRRGTVDRRAALRRMRGNLGEPVQIDWRHRARHPRRIVWLIDVSGSMSPYADALLRVAHRGRDRHVEVFSVGTRLTRLTTALRAAQVEDALALAAQAVPDWSGGTRLGETLKAFMDRWGRRGLARGAVVIICSDGWERGSADQLADQMSQLSRVAHRIVWVNPHLGSPDYRPIQNGMAAALPYCSDFISGHSLEAFRELLDVVARA